MGKWYKKKKDFYTPEQRAAYASRKQQQQQPTQHVQSVHAPSHLKPSRQRKWLTTPLPETGKKRKSVTPVLASVAPIESRSPEVHYPPSWDEENTPGERFIQQSDECFDRLLSRCYEGFIVERQVPHLGGNHDDDGLHKTFAGAFEAMDADGVFRKDATQPMGLGTACTPTSVWRTLVGDMGMTYKYLGIRMFAHPWDHVRAGDIGDDAIVALLSRCGFVMARDAGKKTKKKRKPPKFEKLAPWAQQVCAANALVRHRAELQLQSLAAQRRQAFEQGSGSNARGRKDCSEAGRFGSAAFNVALVNRCLPLEETPRLKPDPTYGDSNDRVAVSWHADSSLEAYSTISVYHREQPLTPALFKQVRTEGSSWRLALRVAPDSEGPGQDIDNRPKSWKHHVKAAQSPKVVVPLISGDVYHMLDSFNHHHQHCVFAGNTHRYGSTHRVVSQATCSVFEVLKRGLRALEASVNAGGADGLGIGTSNASSTVLNRRNVGSTKPPSKRRRCNVRPVLHNLGDMKNNWRTEQQVLNDIEFEWLRQWYVQGEAHDRLLRPVFWGSAVKALGMLWARLEESTASHFEQLLMARGQIEDGGNISMGKLETEQMCTLLRDELEQRARLRKGWLARERDPLFTSRKRPADERPLCPPFRFSKGNAAAAQGESAGKCMDSADNGNVFEWPASPLPYNLMPLVAQLS